MATVMIMHWPGVTRDQYEQVRRDVNWEGDVPDGAKFHVAWEEPDGLHVIDLWNSGQDFQTFVDGRLMAGVARAGIQTQPNVKLEEPIAVFAPNV